MKRKGNPFTLTFGRQPAEYISRPEATDTIISTFDAEHPVSQTYLIDGVRGSGKTVLMTAISRELAEDGDWIIVNLNATQDLMEEFAVKLTDACRLLPDFLRSGFSVSAFGIGVGVNADSSLRNSSSILNDLLRTLTKKQKKILVTIDEVANTESMRHFASEFQIFVRNDYPVYLLMTGLYENIYAIQNDPALTFLLRSPKMHLDPLSIPQITKQYRLIFQTDFQTANQLALLTKGYAFAFQALGMLYYEYHDSLSLDEILSKLDDMLDDFVYRKIWELLSHQEKIIMRTLPEETVRVKEICDKLNMTSGTFSQYRDRLIKRGLLLSPSHGYITASLPHFSVIVSAYMM